MKEIDLKELKRLQCEVLKAVHDFCKEEGIKYSLACGTLLGAIRHNGYIPWDDDIDIYMERADYDRFVNSFPDNYMGHYKLVSFEKDKKWCRPYANVYDDRTIFMEHKSSIERTIGVSIDVFPVDNVPDDEKEWMSFNKNRRLLIYIQTSKHVAFRFKNRSMGKNIVILLLKVALFPFSAHFLVKTVDKYIRRYNVIKTSRLFESACGMMQKSPFLKSDFNESIPHVFENYSFNIMKGYDDYLTNGFGDYMQLPPVEKRISHHYFKAYWK